MAKSLVLAPGQHLSIRGVVAPAVVTTKSESGAVIDEYAIEINAITNKPTAVPFNELNTINGQPLFFNDKSVWRAPNA